MDQDSFFIDHSLVAPEPFDRAIANLDMRTNSNSASNGVTLSLSANFGCDYVDIKLSDGGVIEAKCEIYQALIVARAANCHFADVGNIDHDGGYTSNKTVVSHEEDFSNLQGGAGVNLGESIPGVIGLGQKQLAHHESHQVTKSATSTERQVQFGADQIHIFPNADGSPLVGQIVQSANCFRVIPTHIERPFGVLAELIVRRNWMKLSDPRPRSLSKRLEDTWNSVFSGSSDLAEFHQEAFQILIEDLVRKGLQSDAEQKYATLAARSFRAQFSTAEVMDHYYSNLTGRSITLPVEDLRTVLSGDHKQVFELLIEKGIDDESIAKLGSMVNDVDDLKYIDDVIKSDEIIVSGKSIKPKLDAHAEEELIDIVAFLEGKASVEIKFSEEISKFGDTMEVVSLLVERDAMVKREMELFLGRVDSSNALMVEIILSDDRISVYFYISRVSFKPKLFYGNLNLERAGVGENYIARFLEI